MKTIEQVMETREQHTSKVSPGLPTHIDEQHGAGYAVAQGDMNCIVIDEVPAGYVLIETRDEDRQLVPHNGTPGSHHRLKSFDGVKLYRRSDWGIDESDIRGPVVVFDKPNAIVHESGTANPHGTVHIDCSKIIQIEYQRNLDAEGRARRAQD